LIQLDWPLTSTLQPFQFLLAALAGWLNRHQEHVIDYLLGENRNVQKAKLAYMSRQVVFYIHSLMQYTDNVYTTGARKIEDQVFARRVYPETFVYFVIETAPARMSSKCFESAG